MSSIADDYLSRNARLLPHFAGPPEQLTESPPAIAPLSPDVVAEVNAQQAALGLTVTMPDQCAVMATGQQPALFAGPMYTVYKAITAIKIAEKLRGDFGTNVVPLFWVGGDDHDFDEARTTHILTRNHSSHALRFEPQNYQDGMPLYRIPADASMHALLDEAAALAPGSELSTGVLATLHQTIEESTDFADATARILATLFKETGLLVFTSSKPGVRRLATPVFRKEIDSPLEVTRLVREAADALSGMGYNPQLQRKEDECNFFVECNGIRRKVLYRDATFIVPDEQARYSRQEMRALLEQHPERFSPNVVLRCVLQQHLFPAAAYVAGPGEIAYWAQFKPVFEWFGLPMPIVYPRAQAVCATAKTIKLMGKLGLVIDELGGSIDALTEQVLRGSSSNPATAVLTKGRHDLLAIAQRMRNDLAAIRPGVDRQLAAFEERLAGELERIERAILMEDVGKVDTVRSQIERLRATLLPGGKPQERIYCVLSFLCEYGWELVPRLLQELDVTSFKLNWIEL